MLGFQISGHLGADLSILRCHYFKKNPLLNMFPEIHFIWVLRSYCASVAKSRCDLIECALL
jgi:hypothetical protein